MSIAMNEQTLASGSPLNEINSSNETLHQQMLDELSETLKNLPEIEAKKAIKIAASNVEREQQSTNNLEEKYTLPGDDCAAFKAGNGYQLLAMEGMLPNFVKTDPRAAGWSSVMANVSDIAAMGGRPTAIVNAFWHNNDEESNTLIFHLKRACDAFGVKFSGGHSSIQQTMQPNLAVAITGYANKLLSCYHIQPTHKLFMLTDLTGSWHGDSAYWGCVIGKTNEQIQHQWRIPADIAEKELAVAAKDISNGGILGTLIMMLELNNCGVTLNLDNIPAPESPYDIRWLKAFQSYGFLLAVPENQATALSNYFSTSHLTCTEIGTFNDTQKIQIQSKTSSTIFWDMNNEQLTNMGKKPIKDSICQP